MLAPVGIFAYNRADKARRLLKSLMACSEFGQSPVRVFIDGPKDDRDAKRVNEVKSIFDAVDHLDLQIRVHSENRGLRTSLSSGVSALCNEFGRAIILEDDLEVASSALTFLNAALDKYSDNDRIWNVCVDVPQIEQADLSTAKFLPFTNSWGWATWSRAWQHFDVGAGRTFAQNDSRTFRERFSVHGLRDYPTALSRANGGLTDSWFIYWQFANVIHNALSVYPPSPLVRNNGFSGGTHASRFNLMRFDLTSSKPFGEFAFSLPDVPQIDFEFLDQYISSREWRILRLNSLLGGLRRRLLKRTKG